MRWSHSDLEKNIGWMAVLILITISIGGLVEIVPLYFQRSTTEPVAGLKPYAPLALIGRDLYVREGCYNCHSQMIRPLRAETERYGHYSVAGEFVYDRPFQWGSKRTGPDLARVGGRYSDEWHRLHLENPRALVPESNMPSYAWLNKATVDHTSIEQKMRVLKGMGHPYTAEEIAGAAAAVKGKTEMEAMIFYLQGLGLHVKRDGGVVKPTAVTAAVNSGAVR
jgi:cytochrome c oxidase cbb3-type subunit II